MKRIIVFDDSTQRLDSVKLLLDMSPDLECVGCFKNTANVLENIATTQPDLVLMDIDMPGGDGIHGTIEIRKKYPDLPVLIQTIFEENDKIFESLRAGANGYILKKTSPEKFLASIHEALAGGAPMSGEIAVKVLNYFSNKSITNDYNLTAREKEILKFLVDGYSYKMIATECNISYNTVNNHIHKIYNKLYVNSATEAVSLAIKEKLV
jgi:DNA-binding NarL/FixJ family response regulator